MLVRVRNDYLFKAKVLQQACESKQDASLAETGRNRDRDPLVIVPRGYEPDCNGQLALVHFTIFVLQRVLYHADERFYLLAFVRLVEDVGWPFNY